MIDMNKGLPKKQPQSQNTALRRHQITLERHANRNRKTRKWTQNEQTEDELQYKTSTVKLLGRQ